MPIIAKVESPLYDEPDSEEYVQKENIFYHHSTHAGKLVVARCLGETDGGLVYMSDDKWTAQEPTPRDIARVISDKHLHKFLFPWHSVKIPTRLDGGEPATLTLQHQPTYIVLEKIRYVA
jgi:hypothetical protein